MFFFLHINVTYLHFPSYSLLNVNRNLRTLSFSDMKLWHYCILYYDQLFVIVPIHYIVMQICLMLPFFSNSKCPSIWPRGNLNLCILTPWIHQNNIWGGFSFTIKYGKSPIRARWNHQVKLILFLDSERSDKCIDFTMMCVFFLSVP